MPNALDKTPSIEQEQEIRSRSSWIHACVGLTFLMLGILFWFVVVILDPKVGLAGACGLFFGIAAMGFASHLNVVQAKTNIAIWDAIKELRNRK